MISNIPHLKELAFIGCWLFRAATTSVRVVAVICSVYRTAAGACSRSVVTILPA